MYALIGSAVNRKAPNNLFLNVSVEEYKKYIHIINVRKVYNSVLY